MGVNWLRLVVSPQGEPSRRGFEFLHVHRRVAQVGCAFVSKTKGCRFEPCLACLSLCFRTIKSIREGKMSEHVHKWKIWVAGYQVDNRCHGDRWIQCKCGEWRSNEQAEVMLNATERLSADVAHQVSTHYQKRNRISPAKFFDRAWRELRAYADTLEGK